ncbi:MAG: cupin domain-containing protein [Eubacteriales bacterium]
MKYIIDASEIPWKEAPPPFTRFAKVLYSGLNNPEGAQVSLGLFRFKPGKFSAAHTHEKEVEIYFTTSGKGKVIIDSKEYDVKPGIVAYIPPGIEHQPVNDGDDDWEFLAIFAPAMSMNFVEGWEAANP